MSAFGNYEVVIGSKTAPAFSTVTIPAPTGKVVFSLNYVGGTYPDIRSYPSSDGSEWTLENTGSFSPSVTYRLVVAEMGC